MLYYVALFSVSALILFAFIYWSTAAHLARQTTQTIDAEIAGLAERYETDGLIGLSTQIRDRIARQQPTGTSVYLLADGRYEPIVGNLNRWPRDAIGDGGWLNFELTDARAGEGSVHMARARPFRLRGGFRLLVGRDIRELEAVQRRIVTTLAWGVGIMLLLASGGGILMSRTVVRRIETINDTSREIMSGDLSRRIPTRGSNDDFDQLAGNLNNMLERIEALMESVRRVSDNVAHDLRTPLSRLRNRLEEARAQAPDPARQRATLDAAVADADQLLSTFNAVLRIARIEAKRETATFVGVDLRSLVTDVAELYEPLAADKDQRIVTSNGDPVVINGDRDLLFQALANLVDNAVKYTPAGGTVQIHAGFDHGAARLLVEDTGPGIPQAFRDRVFQRFFRIDPSRKTPGSGLGLSLVAAVAALHDMAVGLDDARPGLRVTLRFPDLTRSR